MLRRLLFKDHIMCIVDNKQVVSCLKGHVKNFNSNNNYITEMLDLRFSSVFLRPWP